MVPKNKLSIDLINCNKFDLKSTQKITELLKSLPSLLKTKSLSSPIVIAREDEPNGVVGVLINSSSHVIIHTFSFLKEVTIDIYSYQSFNENEFKSKMIDFFGINLRDLKVSKTPNTQEEFIECEMSGCTSKASKDWGGLNVCRDHYEKYQEEHFKDISDMNEY